MAAFPLLRKVSIGKRLYLLSFIVTVLTLLPLALFIANYQTNIMEQKRVKTRHLVESAHSLLGYYHSLEQQGSLTQAQAQEQAIDALAALRYEQTDYFWINDMAPAMVMHPFKPALNGQRLDTFTDPNGTALFVKMANIVRQQGQGFVDYYWEKPGFSTPVEKISFVKGFAPWGWIVGSGIYVDDVTALFLSELQQFSVFLLSALALSALLAWVITRSITIPCHETACAMRDIAEGDGDLTQRLPCQGDDELSQLARSFNTFSGHLSDMLRDIAPISDQISAAASQLNSVATQTAGSANQAYRGIDNVAAAMNQLHTNNQDIAQSAQQAADAAEQAQHYSTNSIAVVSNSAKEMHALLTLLDEANDSAHALESDSQTIGSVLDVIRGIAEQTNLLALNAAIEAARAGEQGRGFAVVADEVRTLATRTQSSTNEIETIIASLQDKAGSVSGALVKTREQSSSTAEHADEVAQTLSAIGQQVSTILTLNQHIAEASDQQSQAAEAINQTLHQLTEHSHQTAEHGDHIAAASTQLLASGESLESHISHFKI
ncbi:methyl-accepting chemotaxis protein [Photobacterium sp. DA100]|uniref:methyl-accepting chemotaxis protein n=1 Tax=Photobacterium sp. DA100 TaxID=3027472 RepID=UPI00247ACAD5|nr:methyl-accepting chemotaxis protein [Photobacterium sp. DA100]WEM41699.1 methyl-accepting chemotaxis protein [Photobacterium sp. DA100]